MKDAIKHDHFINIPIVNSETINLFNKCCILHDLESNVIQKYFYLFYCYVIIIVGSVKPQY